MKRVFLGILFLVSAEAFSLDCIAPSVKEQIMQTEDIFVGEIIRIIAVEKLAFTDWPYDAEERILAELKVIDVLKGHNRTLQIVDFSYQPDIGEQYLIFNNSAFSTNCDISLSQRLKNAGGLLKMLGYQGH